MANAEFNFRALLVKIQDLLSDNDRHRLHFLFGPHVPKYLRDDPSMSGALRVLESLFDKAIITDQDCDYLINALKAIHCHDAAKRLQEYQRNRQQSNEDSFSIQDVILQVNQDKKNSGTAGRRANRQFNNREVVLSSSTILAVLALIVVTILWIRSNRPNLKKTLTCPPCGNRSTQGKGCRPIGIGELQTDISTPYYVAFVTTYPDLPVNASWIPNATIVAGGDGPGAAMNQLKYPYGLYVDEDQSVLIADTKNHRIVEWKLGAINGEIIAGNSPSGSHSNQLKEPTTVIVDDDTGTLLICDRGNRRVMRWPRRNGTHGEILIEEISCWGIAMDKHGFLYVSDHDQHEVKRYRIGEKDGRIVAGGNGKGKDPNQLNGPSYLFIDDEQSIYVSEPLNHRVTKWRQNNPNSTVVAGGHSLGNRTSQLNYPCGLLIDRLATVYVMDSWNGRVMRWLHGATEGTIVLDYFVENNRTEQLYRADGLSFDLLGNLYVVDYYKHRVLRFPLQKIH